MKKIAMGLFALMLGVIATACNPMDYLPGNNNDEICGGQRSPACPQ
jgi:hypothetical protein